MRISKSMILPIIAVLAFFIQTVFHINISLELQNEFADIIVNAVLFVGAVIGVVKNHH